VRYWRGFALWRRAINGFNESADPKDLEHDLTQAIAEFKESAAKDPAFVDAKVGTISCLGSLIYLALGHADRVQELIAQSSPLVKELRTSSPDNPRLSGYSALFFGTFLRSVAADRTRPLKTTKRDWKRRARPRTLPSILSIRLGESRNC